MALQRALINLWRTWFRAVEETPFDLVINERSDAIRWQDGSTSPIYRVTEAGIYSVEVIDGACEFTDTISIMTRECFRFRVYAPTAFSPNGDGNNDEFTIGIPPDMEIMEYEMQIFDRWGNLRYVGNDIEVGWDGLFNGEPSDAGVYIYSIRIKFRDDFKTDEEIYSGDVLLMR